MKKYIKTAFKQMQLYFGLIGIALVTLSFIYCDPNCAFSGYYIDIIVKKDELKFPYKVCFYYQSMAGVAPRDRCLFEEGNTLDTISILPSYKDACSKMDSRDKVKEAAYYDILKAFDTLIIFDADNTILAKFYGDKYGKEIKPDYIKEGYKFKSPTDYRNNWEVGINEDNYPKWNTHVVYAIFEFEELE